ncbi:hypothetical protein [Streptomyces sp. NPDC006856]|uniref:hypothetical protein n=1 Tax=Streptomyces sp. NPDC006856 TaxID=3364766 RepID=UPI0036A96BA4
MLNIAAADEETAHQVVAEQGWPRATSGVAALRRDPRRPRGQRPRVRRCSTGWCRGGMDRRSVGQRPASGLVRPWC